MRIRCSVSTATVSLCVWLTRLGLVAALAIAGTPIALGQTRPGGDPAPQAGGIGSLPDSVLMYPGKGAAGACGQDCSQWLAAEGTIYWDGHKRIIAGLDRFADRKPIYLDVRGQGDLGVATSIGRLLRERGIDVGVGRTIVDQCRALSEPDCAALKRSGIALNASLASIRVCDLTCVLILAGGVRRMLPGDTAVVIQGTQISNRLGLNVPDQHREGLHAWFRAQTKIYLTQMGVDPALADMVDANYGVARGTPLSRADVVRLRIVTGP